MCPLAFFQLFFWDVVHSHDSRDPDLVISGSWDKCSFFFPPPTSSFSPRCPLRGSVQYENTSDLKHYSCLSILFFVIIKFLSGEKFKGQKRLYPKLDVTPRQKKKSAKCVLRVIRVSQSMFFSVRPKLPYVGFDTRLCKFPARHLWALSLWAPPKCWA